MSLYQISKLLYTLNRDDAAKALFATDRHAFTTSFALEEEERRAVIEADIGLLYVLGVNGQILMHFAALCGIEWSDYLQLMRDGVQRHGPVRAGLYRMTTSPDQKAFDA